MFKIRILTGMQAAREKISRHRALTDKSVSPETNARIEAIFGESLSPENAVTRILDDVQARGDDAVRGWTEKIDGVVRQEFQVSSEEIETAYQETPEAVRDALHTAILETLGGEALRYVPRA